MFQNLSCFWILGLFVGSRSFSACKHFECICVILETSLLRSESEIRVAFCISLVSVYSGKSGVKPLDWSVW